MATLHSTCGHSVLPLWLLSFFFFLTYSQQLQIGCLPYYDTSTHDVVLVQTENAGLKCAAHSSLKTQDAKNTQNSPSAHQISQLEFIMAALHSRRGHYILPCGFFLLSSFFPA